MISKAVEHIKIFAFLKEKRTFHKLGSVLSLWLESFGFSVLEFLFTQVDLKGQFVLKALIYFALSLSYKNL